MNTNQLHQIKLSQWSARFNEQAASGLTVKAWCSENNISVHTYNYWKHQLKQEFVDSVLPDIVPLLPVSPARSSDLDTPSPISNIELHSSRDSLDTNSICISTGNIQIRIGTAVSDDCILQLLKAVRHA